MHGLSLVGMLLCFSAACYLALVRARCEAGHVPVALAAFAIGLRVLGGAVDPAAPQAFEVSAGMLGHFVGTALVAVALLVA